MRRQLVGSVRAGESTKRVAERLLDIDNPVVELPRHVGELRDAARFALHTGDRNLYHEEIAKWRGRIEKLGQQTGRKAGPESIRSATQDLVRRLGKVRTDDQIDHIVDRWVLERARHQQRLVARHETVEGYRDNYLASTADKPYVKGYRWILSASGHKHVDECDTYAGQDLYGLGPGGYPADALPATPHPRCIPPGHLVETSRGPLPIEHITPGMRVRTHTGAFRPVLRLSECFWRGELVVASIGERELVATPEHPVLTTRGWERADRLQPDDRVFVRVDTHDAPSDGGEILLLRGVGAHLVRRHVPVPGVDLDGDLKATDPTVDVELSDGELGRDIKTVLRERVNDAALVIGDHARLLHPQRSTHLILEGLALASNSAMRALRHLLTLFRGSARGCNQLLVRHRAELNARALQAIRDGGPSSAELPSDRKHAHAFANVERNDFLGFLTVNLTERIRHALSRSACGSGLGPVFRGHALAGDGGGLLLGSQGHPLGHKSTLDRVTAAAEPKRQGPDRELLLGVEPGDFSRDEIMPRSAAACAASSHFHLASVSAVSRKSYAGPVHNFAVERDESYCVNGVVTHNCLCSQVAISDTRHFQRERARRRGDREPPRDWESGRTETSEEWLRAKPEKFQREMLGPTRFEAFKRGDTVLDRFGKPLPVHVVTGKSKPRRTPGQRVSAVPAIRRDRRNMVRPFPRVPPAPR